MKKEGLNSNLNNSSPIGKRGHMPTISHVGQLASQRPDDRKNIKQINNDKLIGEKNSQIDNNIAQARKKFGVDKLKLTGGKLEMFVKNKNDSKKLPVIDNNGRNL